MELMEAGRLRSAAGESLVIHHDVFRFLPPLQVALDGPAYLLIFSPNSYTPAPP
jgi:hypothetical protein